MILIVSTQVLYPNSVYFDKWDAATFLPFVFMPGLVMPLLLLIVGLVRKKLKPKQNQI